MSRKVVNELFQWLVALVLAAAIVIPIRVYVLQPYRVYMTSMVPTLEPGDIVIGLKSTIVGKSSHTKTPSKALISPITKRSCTHA